MDKNDYKPLFEPVVAEEYEDYEEKQPLIDAQGNFVETTTPKEKPFIENDDKVVTFEVEAVEAEEEEEGLLDAAGNFIRTTTGTPKDLFEIDTSIEGTENLSEPSILNKVAKVTLEKLPRGADSDVKVEESLQEISTESPNDLVPNITDPSDRPGSILTTLIGQVSHQHFMFIKLPLGGPRN